MNPDWIKILSELLPLLEQLISAVQHSSAPHPMAHAMTTTLVPDMWTRLAALKGMLDEAAALKKK